VCQVEFLLASQLGKHIFGVIITPTPFSEMPRELTAHYQLVDVSNPATRAEGFERFRFGLKRAGLDPEDFLWPPPDEPHRPAYRGLQSLGEEDAGIFFGRDAPITRGLDALRRLRDGAPERMLVILGASGAGKSSFLKAGLLARLLRDEENFIVLPAVRPERAGLTGAQGLLRAVGLEKLPTEENLQQRMEKIRRPVLERLQRYAEVARENHVTRTPTLILPIDQAEELFSSDNTERAYSLDLLKAIFATERNLVAVLTLRSDSLSRLQNESRLVEVPRLLFDLPRLSSVAFKEIIEGPGRLARPEIHFEPALTERLVADLDTEDALPLLAFTLERLVVEFGGDGQLELGDFIEGLGGLEGAVHQAVEAAFAAAQQDLALPTERAALEALARRTFLPWLVTVDDDDAPPKKRRTPTNELPAKALPLVRHLVNQRLLVSDRRDGTTTVEVSHEAVLRHWRAVAVWIDSERDALRTLNTVQAAAKERLRQARILDSPESEPWLIHLGERLAEAEELQGRPDYRQFLGDSGSEYLAACRRLEDKKREKAEQRLRREQQHLERQRRLQQRAAAALLLVALAAVAFTTFAVRQTRAASAQASLVLADYAQRAIKDGYLERGTRLAALAAREGLLEVADPAAAPTLAAAAQRSSMVMEIRGHRFGIKSLVTFLDGSRFATEDYSRTIRIWDTVTGAEIAAWRCEGATDLRTGIEAGWTLDNSRKRVLLWCGDLAWVRDSATGTTVSTLEHESGITSASFDSTGQRVLTRGDRGAKLWDTKAATRIGVLEHEGGVDSAKFDATGERVLTLGNDTAQLWDAATAARIGVLEHNGGVDSAKFDAKGKRVLTLGNGTGQLWDAATAARIGVLKHNGGVDNAEFDAKGKRVLTSGSETGRVWDAETGGEIATWNYESGVRGVKFDTAGERVLSWHDDRTVRVRKAASDAKTRISKHEAAVVDAAFSAAGDHVLSWDRDGLVRVWNADTGAVVAVSKHEGEIEDAMFDPGGGRVLSWDKDGVARVWHAETVTTIANGEQEARFGGLRFRDRVDGAKFDPPGKRVLAWGDQTARVFAASTGVTLGASTHESRILGARFDASGKRVISWDLNGILKVWTAETVNAIDISKHEGLVEAVKFDSLGDRLFTWGKDGVARIWDIAKGTEVTAWKHESRVQGASFDPSGKRVLTWSRDGTARIWDITKGTELTALEHEGRVSGAKFDASGERVLSWSSDGFARIWNAAVGYEADALRRGFRAHEERFDSENERMPPWVIGRRGPSWTAASKHEGQVNGAIFDPSGERVLSWDKKGTARVWNAASGTEIAALEHGSSVEGAIFDDSGERVLSWGWDGYARVWNAVTGVEIASSQHELVVYGARFDPSGKHVLSWGGEEIMRVWDALTGKELATSHHRFSVSGAVFDASGGRVLSWGGDSIARVWNAATGAEIAAFQHEDAIYGARFGPLGQRVLSWSQNGIARVWNAATGVELVISEHKSTFVDAMFELGGERWLSWGSDGTVRVWDASWSLPRSSNRSLIAEVCGRKLRGTEAVLITPFVNGNGRTITSDSVRRISTADAAFAPILRKRVGEDVCPSPSLARLE